MILKDSLAAPSAKHLMGADNMGRDVTQPCNLWRAYFNFVGLGASALQVIVGTLIGVTSAYVGGNLT